MKLTCLLLFLTFSRQVFPFIKQPATINGLVAKSNLVTQRSNARMYVITVTGKITDEATGEPLPGVNITVLNTSIGTTTDAQGTFRINVPNGKASLRFSSIGYISADVMIGNRTFVEVQLRPSDRSLDEVVVVGYGTERKSDLTGSVGQVGVKTLDRLPTATLDLKLQGQVAGVMVTNTSAEPGGNVSIRIRGNNSISGNNEPLYVIDGYPLPPGGEANGADRQQNSNFLSGINPADIVSIEILKDASASAIYGSRAANGVVLITTKRGKEGRGRVDFNYQVTSNTITNVPTMMNMAQYASLINTFEVSQGRTPPYNGSQPYLPTPETAGEGVNWVDRITQPSLSQMYQMNISGGKQGNAYLVSGGYLDDQGVIRYTGFKRGSLRVNLDNQVSQKFKIASSLSLTRSVNNRTASGSGNIIAADPIFQALRAIPTDRTGDISTLISDPDRFNYTNPEVELRDKKDVTANLDLIANTQFNYALTNNLTLVTRAGATYRNSTRDIFRPRTTWQGYLSNSQAYVTTFNNFNYLVEPYLTYVKKLGKSSLNVTAGGTWQKDVIRYFDAQVSNFPTDVLTTDNLGVGLTRGSTTTSRLERTLLSAYLRATYNYADRYLLTVTGRRDGSSVFAQNNKWGTFPSVALAWRASEESFLKSVKALTNLKFRASYGITGSQAIPPLGSLTRIGAANYNFGATEVSGFAPLTQFGNPDLQWERTRQWNVGTDFELLDNRISVTGDYFTKTTEGLLRSLLLSPTTGYNSVLTNVGSIRNRGVEVSLTGRILTGNVKWTANANYTTYTSKILDLGGPAEILGGAPLVNITTSPSNTMRVGEEFASFIGYVVDGLQQTSDYEGGVISAAKAQIPLLNSIPDLGGWKFRDINGDKVVNEKDKIILGSPNPDFFFGLTNTFSYKNLELSVFFQGVIGQKLMNFTAAYLRSGYVNGNKTAEWYEHRWTPTNPTNDVRYPAYNINQSTLQSSSVFLEDGSFVRLKNVTLSYTLPPVSKWFQNAQVYFTGVNLATFTNYSGMDPEVNIFGQNNTQQGIDYGAYPRARNLIVGLRLGF